MECRSFCRKILRSGLLVGLGGIFLLFHMQVSAGDDAAVDFDQCDPVIYRSLIMGVVPGKSELVVAEKVIRVVDLMIAEGDRFRTELIDMDENPLTFDTFERGQMVLIQGFRHPDGYVIAASIQLLPSHPAKETSDKVRPLGRSRKSIKSK